MIKRLAGWAFVASACLTSAAFAADGAAPAAAPAAAASAATAPVAINPEHPSSYTVKPGDTLWGISEKFLQNPWQWPEVWHINEQVKNPHMIYPGDVLRLVWKDGKPSLVVDGGTAGIGSGNSIVEVVDGNTVKLKPRIREMPVASAIPAIPLKNIEAFLNDSRVVAIEELNAAPYVVAGPERRIVMGLGDKIYARSQTGDWNDNYPEYGVYRAAGKPYLDPVTGEVLGYEAKKIGATRILETEGDIATMSVLASDQELLVDDRLMYDDQRKVQSIFYPQPAPDGVEGQIIHIFNTIGFGARNDVIVINKGTREAVNAGHVFAIMQKGETVRDRRKGDAVTLPSTRVGLAVVFRSFDKVSYALVTRSTRPIKRGDLLQQPRIDIE